MASNGNNNESILIIEDDSNNNDQENIKDNNNFNENENLALEAVTEYSVNSENSHVESVNDKVSEINNETDTEVQNEIDTDNENHNDDNIINDIDTEAENHDNEHDNDNNNKNNNNENNVNTNTDIDNKDKANKAKVHNKRPSKVINEVRDINDDDTRIYKCQWDTCYNSYELFDELIKHLNEDHIDTIDRSTEYGCLWRSCQRRDKVN